MELSGLVATATGTWWSTTASSTPASIRIFYLDQRCKVTGRSRTRPRPATPRIWRSAGTAPSGSPTSATTDQRPAPADHRAVAGAGRRRPPVIHRLTYPDGPHDAEALLFDRRRRAGHGHQGGHRHGRPVRADRRRCGRTPPTGVPLTRAGAVPPQASGTENSFGVIGEMLVTGAATAPDRRRVVLRTYTDAYEWDVPDGDVVKAITTATPGHPAAGRAPGRVDRLHRRRHGVPDRERPDRRSGDDPADHARRRTLLISPTPDPGRPTVAAATARPLLARVPLGAVGVAAGARAAAGRVRLRRGAPVAGRTAAPSRSRPSRSDQSGQGAGGDQHRGSGQQHRPPARSPRAARPARRRDRARRSSRVGQRDRGHRARARAAGQRLADAALVHPHRRAVARAAGRGDDELDVRPGREARAGRARARRSGRARPGRRPGRPGAGCHRSRPCPESPHRTVVPRCRSCTGGGGMSTATVRRRPARHDQAGRVRIGSRRPGGQPGVDAGSGRRPGRRCRTSRRASRRRCGSP